jgi:hypothetical protein
MATVFGPVYLAAPAVSGLTAVVVTTSADLGGRPSFAGPVITEVSVPKLDATSKDASTMTIKVTL